MDAPNRRIAFRPLHRPPAQGVRLLTCRIAPAKASHAGVAQLVRASEPGKSATCSTVRTINNAPPHADTVFSRGGIAAPRETAMANRTSSQSEFGSDLQLLAGVWALVCIAVLTTVALV